MTINLLTYNRPMLFVVSDLHEQMKPAESLEPPIEPQAIVTKDPVVAFSEAKLYKKLFDKLKGTLAHFLYLGKDILR